MARIEFDAETRATPEQVVAALTDFTERRPDIWQGLSRDAYQVYSIGENTAEVREGNVRPRIWARERYDWSPTTVRWEVLESNFCEPGSFVEVQIAPREGNGSQIHGVWSRTPTSFKWQLMLSLIVLSRGAPVKSSLAKGLDRYLSLTGG